MKVEVRPIPRKKWHGKEGKNSFTRPKVIEALYDSKSDGYATGLTKEEEQFYGEKLGLDLNNRFDPETSHPVWGSKSFSITLKDNTQFFETKIPREAVLVKVMKASKHVANSMKEYEQGKWPYATHVIFDEEEEIEEKAAKVEIKQEINGLLADMSADEKIAVIQLMSNKSLRGKSGSFIVVELDEIMNDTDNERVKELHRVIKMSKTERMSRATILEAIGRQLLIKDGSNITWMGDTIGHTVEDAAKWLVHPENQTIKSRILEKLQS